MLTSLSRVSAGRRVVIVSQAIQGARRLSTPNHNKQASFRWAKWIVLVPATIVTVVAVRYYIAFKDISYLLTLSHFVTRGEVEAFRKQSRKIIDAEGDPPTKWKELTSPALTTPLVLTLQRRYASASPESRWKAQTGAKYATMQLLDLSNELKVPAMFSVEILLFFTLYTQEEWELIFGCKEILQKMRQGVLPCSDHLRKLRAKARKWWQLW